MTTKPALTEEEWGRLGYVKKGERPQRVEFDEGDLVVHDGWESAVPSPEMWHALAALCLHGQPFGFTWEDVEFLRGLAEAYSFGPDDDPDGTSRHCDSLADRIASLLSPREP